MTPISPIRAELFSAERLEEFAGTLAGEQLVHPRMRRGRRLIPRLRDNARVLAASQRAIAEASRQTRTVSPAAEWLLNNFRGAGSRGPGGPPAGVLSGAAQARLGTARGLSGPLLLAIRREILDAGSRSLRAVRDADLRLVSSSAFATRTRDSDTWLQVTDPL